MKRHGRKPVADAAFAYRGLDRVIHEHARLCVLTALMTNRGVLSFRELKQMCTLTDGNLSRHIQVLGDAGIVNIIKGTEHNRSVTLCRVTPAGRKRFMEYLTVLETILRDAGNAIDAGEPQKHSDRVMRM